MSRFLRLNAGVLKSFDETGTAATIDQNISIYDQNVVIDSNGLISNSAITLPSSQTYTSSELEVYLNNLRLTPIVDYNYVGEVPRTQIVFNFDLSPNDVIRLRIDRLPDETGTSIYDQNVTIDSNGLDLESTLTLPCSQTYNSNELEVYLNNLRLTPVLDYNYVGIAPRTQISFNFSLLNNDIIRLRIDRPA